MKTAPMLGGEIATTVEREKQACTEGFSAQESIHWCQVYFRHDYLLGREHAQEGWVPIDATYIQVVESRGIATRSSKYSPTPLKDRGD